MLSNLLAQVGNQRVGSRRSRVGSQDYWSDRVSEHHHWTESLTPLAPLSQFSLGLAAGISQNVLP